MAPDIRSFFGGGGGRAPEAPIKKEVKDAKSAKKQRTRKVISDDSDDEVIETKPKKNNPKKIKKEATPIPVEETTSSEYFASKGKVKPSRSTPLRPKHNGTTGTTTTPSKETNKSAPSTGRTSTRKNAKRNYADGDEDEVKMLDDDKEDEDIYADDFKTRGRNTGDDYEEDSDEKTLTTTARKPPSKNTVATNGRKKKDVSQAEDRDVEMAEIPSYDGSTDPKRKRGSTVSSTTSTRKRKSKSLDDDEEDNFVDDDEPKKKRPRKTTAKSTPSKPRASAKKEPKEESKEIQAIFDSIETVRAPTPPHRDPDQKFKFTGGGGNAAAAPTDPNSLELPTGAENCLAGLTFVFTGVLENLGREEGTELVKRYGGKVTTAPSSKTSYVVIGNDAGPSKLEKIKKLGIKTIKEKGLFQLISTLPANGGDGVAAEKYAEKKAAEEEKIRKAAEEIEEREKARAKQAAQAEKAAESAAGPGSALRAAQTKKQNNADRLWVDKYAPDSLSAVAGNKTQVEKLQKWLRDWHNSAKWDFKRPGKDGLGLYRAAMLHGPPGIGKTTAAHLVAKLEGFDVVESNASDTRSKKLVEAGLRGVLDTTSLLGFFAGEGKKVEGEKKKLVLIMDEVDGMSAGDRGGVGALAAVAKKTKIPMILICNERRLPKMKPFDFITADLQFKRPTTDQIRSRIMTICFREGMRIPPQVVDALIVGSHADIRQVINMISTAKLSMQPMDYDDGKAMAKAWEKHIILKPWDIVAQILRSQMFSASSTTTLNEKIELYFNDHEFSSLMLQENYLKTTPALLGNINNPRERKLKALELAENAANAISEGDLVDRMIHGTQQQWSLMPTHAVFSFVKPASYVYGNFTERSSFTTWLGMNSKQGKLSRFVKEIQGHMRLKASGDRHEIRQQYLPALWNKTVRPLQASGKEAVQDVIDFMDSYYLTKDDYDAIIELGVGPMDQENVKLETATKAAFTRTYNLQSHPLSFIKASSVGNPIGGKSKKEKPDLEEAVDESDDDAMVVDVVEVDDEEDGEIDLKKDKYIAKPKKKPAKKAAATKGKGKSKAKDDDDEDDDGSEEPEEAKPKKKASARGGRGGGRGRGKV